jgi:small subunit ribosomal protein S17
MFRRKKKEEETEQPVGPEVTPEAAVAEPAATGPAAEAAETSPAATSEAAAPPVAPAKGQRTKGGRGNRVQKVGIVSSDKMQKTVVVRVDRQVLHTKYRRYVRRTTRFKAHDELGATIGDRVRIVETRPLSAQKRWRVVEILQKAAK